MNVHANVLANVHTREILKHFLPRGSQAVKGGEAETPDASAPSLEGQGLNPNHDE